MRLAVALVVYIAAIVTANVMTARLGLVPIGFGLVVTAGTFAAGFALLARDFVQRYGGIAWAWGAIAVGGVLSWLLASPALALASTVAFAGAEAVDLLVFTRLREHGFLRAVLISNVISAPIDTVLFLWLAGFGVTWQAVLGQFIAKIVYATIIPLVLYALARRAVPEPSVDRAGP